MSESESRGTAQVQLPPVGRGPSDLYLLRNCCCCRVTCCLLPVHLLFRSFSSRQLQISSAATGIIPLMLLYIYFLNLTITKIPLSTKLTTRQNYNVRPPFFGRNRFDWYREREREGNLNIQFRTRKIEMKYAIALQLLRWVTSCLS